MRGKPFGFPFLQLISSRLRLEGRGIASIENKKKSIGKAKPFRTSGGRAAHQAAKPQRTRQSRRKTSGGKVAEKPS
jgi:hypothetical protein